jgi:hypothetical protein
MPAACHRTHTGSSTACMGGNPKSS